MVVDYNCGDGSTARTRPGPMASRLKLALVHAIAAHDLAAHALHRAVHRLVDLQDPAHLAALLRRGFSCVEVHLVETGSDAGVLVLGLNAKREHAHRVDLLALAQSRYPAEWQQAAVQLGEH